MSLWYLPHTFNPTCISQCRTSHPHSLLHPGAPLHTSHPHSLLLPGAPLQDNHRALPTHVNFLRQLNEQDGPMLLCGSVDGAVRVWRNYTLKDSHSMATALQVRTEASVRRHVVEVISDSDDGSFPLTVV